MSNTEKRVAIYCRVAKHYERALAAQAERMRAFVDGNDGWVLTGIYSDEAASAEAEKRSGLTKLLADAQARAFDIVAVYSFSRLARSQELFESINRTLSENMVEIVSATGEVLLKYALGAKRE